MHNGNQYEKVQEFDAGFDITGLRLNSERLVVSGFSSEIRIYGSNGTGYWLEQTITTTEPRIYDFHSSSDLAQLLFEDRDGYASTYQHINGSYSFSQAMFVNKSVHEAYLDEG